MILMWLERIDSQMKCYLISEFRIDLICIYHDQMKHIVGIDSVYCIEPIDSVNHIDCIKSMVIQLTNLIVLLHDIEMPLLRLVICWYPNHNRNASTIHVTILLFSSSVFWSHACICSYWQYLHIIYILLFLLQYFVCYYLQPMDSPIHNHFLDNVWMGVMRMNERCGEC